MTNASLFSQLAAWLESHVLVSTVLIVIGGFTVLGLGVSVVVIAARALAPILGLSSVASNGAIRRAGQMPGYRILVGEIQGMRGRQLADRIESALQAHMSDFSFGALFKLFRVAGIRGRPDGRTLDVARSKLKRTGADLVIWGEQTSEAADGLLVHGVSRAGAQGSGSEVSTFSLRLPGRLREYDDGLQRVIALVLAKRLQPALSRPEAFRVEKVEVLGTHLDGMLAAHEREEIVLPDAIRYELEHDFTVITLHLSETSPRNEWLDRVIERRRAAIDGLKESPDPMVLVDARLDLGQALLLRTQASFDPVAVREATVHLNAVIAALRDHDIIRKVQRASDGLQKAQSMVETRRRFAVNFSA